MAITEKLKIGYVTSSVSSVGGWARYSKGVVQAMSYLAEVIVVTRHDAMNDDIRGVRCHRVLPSQDTSLRPRVQLGVFVGAMKHFRGCNVIHCLVEPFGPGAALASLFLGAAFIVTCHGTYAVPPRGYHPKAFFKRQLMRLMLKRAAIATTGSTRTKASVEQVARLREWRVIPNGVDASTFYCSEVETPKEPFVLTVGDLKPRKGVDVTIQALAMLRDELPNVRYKIVGDTAVAPSFLEHVKQLLRDVRLQSRIDFVGKVSDAELRSLYNQCRVFVLAAQTRGDAFEGFPMVFFEANACGAPVITTRGFGSEYAVRDGYNGFLVEPDNVEELALAMRNVLVDTRLRQEMSRNAVEVASEHTWERIAKDHLLEMYSAASKGRGPARRTSS